MSRNGEKQRQLNEQYVKGTVRSPADMDALKRFWESEEQLTASTELPRKAPSRALSRKSGLSMSSSFESSQEDAPLPSPRRSPSQSGLPKNTNLITKIFAESEGLDSSEYGAADASPSPRGGRKQAELERARAEQEAREKEEKKAQRKAEREREKERLREAAEAEEREAEEERFRQEAETRRRKREEIEAQKRKIEEEKIKLEQERRKHEEAMAQLARQREQQEEFDRQQAEELANSKRKKKKKQKEEVIEEEPEEEEQGDFAFNENAEYNGEETDATFIFKLVMVGDSAVGKSSILSRWSHNEFAKDLKATISVESHVKMFKIKRDVIKAQLWDTAGQEKFRSITAQYYRGAKGILIVFDVTKRTSFESVDKWLNEVHNVSDASIPIILIGNKKDMVKNRSVTTEEAIEYSKDHGLNYIETSAKNGTNCSRAISRLLEDVYKNAKTAPVLQAKVEEKKPVPKSQPIVIDAYERAQSGDPFGESVPETGGYKGPDDCANC